MKNTHLKRWLSIVLAATILCSHISTVALALDFSLPVNVQNTNTSALNEDITLSSNDSHDATVAPTSTLGVSSPASEVSTLEQPTPDAITEATSGALVTITFYQENEVLHTQTVIAGEVCSEPSLPEVPADKSAFWGWFTAEAIDAAGNELPSQSQRFDFSAPITQDTALYALFSSQYLVQFEDGAGKVLHSVLVNQGDLVQKPTNLEISSGITGVLFTGVWLTDDNSAYDFSLPVHNNATLRPEFKNAYYVQFITLGEAIDPKLVLAGETLGALSAPLRTGYEFSHWSLSASEDIPFDCISTPITENTILYAVWVGLPVSYRVVYWLEKPNVSMEEMNQNLDNPAYYDYAYSRWTQGIAGTDVTVLSTETLPSDAEVLLLQKSAEGHNNAAPYASFQKSSTEQLSGDGTTIVNVFYTRNIYTLKFTLNIPSTGNVDTVQWRVNADKYETWSNPDDVVTVAELQAKVGMDLNIAEYPHVFSNNNERNFIAYDSNGNAMISSYTQQTMRGWGPWAFGTIQEFGPHHFTTKSYATSYNSATKTVTYASFWSTKQFLTQKYIYLESLDQESGAALVPSTMPLDEDGSDEPRLKVSSLEALNAKQSAYQTIPIDNEYFDLSPTGLYYWATEGDRQVSPAILGFTYISINTASDTSNNYQWNGKDFYQLGKSKNVNQERRYFFYARNSYDLSFDVGAYSSVLQDVVIDKDQIKYEQPLSGYIPTADSVNQALQNADTEVEFQGWYLDASFTEPFNEGSATMPANDLLLFGKFVSKDHLVRFYSSTASNLDDPLLNKWVSTGTTLDKPLELYQEGVGYPKMGTFLGWVWYINNTPFNYSFETYVAKDIELFATWKTAGFSLTYNLDGGTCAIPPIDNQSYDLETDAIAANVSDLTKEIDGETAYFVGWQRQGTNEVYYPGLAVPMYCDTVLVAHYATAYSDNYCTLTYFQNATDSDETQSISVYLPGATISIANAKDLAFSNGNMIFAGWSTEPNAATPDETYTFGTNAILQENLTLYAVWKLAPTPTPPHASATPPASADESIVAPQTGDQTSAMQIALLAAAMLASATVIGVLLSEKLLRKRNKH